MAARGFLGEFEQLVLLAVARLEPEGYGVTLRQEIEQRARRDVAIGAVYATLARLEAKGLVSSREGEPSPVRGGRAKRHFTLTLAGARALAGARQRLARMWEHLKLKPASRPSS